MGASCRPRPPLAGRGQAEACPTKTGRHSSSLGPAPWSAAARGLLGEMHWSRWGLCYRGASARGDGCARLEKRRSVMAGLEPFDEVTQRAIEDVNECALVCVETVAYCLRMGGEHADPDHITVLMDCGEVCTLASSYVLRRSEFAARVLGLTADVCERCAESCERFSDDEWMMDCAESCRNCAQSCREAAGGGPAEEEMAA